MGIRPFGVLYSGMQHTTMKYGEVETSSHHSKPFRYKEVIPFTIRLLQTLRPPREKSPPVSTVYEAEWTSDLLWTLLSL
jgi:hypothetical protein